MANTKTRYIVALAFVILLSMCVRFSILPNYSPQPTNFDGGDEYFLHDLALTGHILSASEAADLKFGAFSGGLIERSIYYFHFIEWFIFSQILGVTFFSWEYRIAVSFLLSLAMLSGAMLFAPKLQKNTIYKLIVLAAFILLATPTIILQSGANGWWLFFFIVFLMFANAIKYRIILIALFSGVLVVTYFTTASFLLLSIGCAFLLLFILDRNYRRIYYIAPIIGYAVIWFIYTNFVSTSRMSDLYAIINHMYWVLYTRTLTTSTSLPTEYIVSTSITNKILLLINATFVVIIALIFVMKYLKAPAIRGKISKFLMVTLLFTMPIFSFLLVIWLGALGIPRVGEYGALITMLALGILLRPRLFGMKEKKILYLIIVLAISSSAIAYTFDENVPFLWSKYTESKASSYLIEYSSQQDVIFTDHRLSASLIGDGHLRTVGITIQDCGYNHSIQYLNSIYYGNDSAAAKRSLTDIIINGLSPSILFFSSYMTNTSPSIRLYETPVVPAPKNFTEKYYSNDFNYVYSNDCIYIFNINE